MTIDQACHRQKERYDQPMNVFVFPFCSNESDPSTVLTKQENKKKKKVRFASRLSVQYYEKHVTNNEIRMQLFYSAKDYEDMESELRKNIEQQMEMGQHRCDHNFYFCQLMTDLYESCVRESNLLEQISCMTNFSSSSSLSSFMNRNSTNLQKDKDWLTEIQTIFDGNNNNLPFIFGMEQYTIGEINQYKQLQKQLLLQEINQIQDNVLMGDDSSWVAEKIRIASERLSLPSRLFATRWATIITFF